MQMAYVAVQINLDMITGPATASAATITALPPVNFASQSFTINHYPTKHYSLKWHLIHKSVLPKCSSVTADINHTLCSLQHAS